MNGVKLKYNDVLKRVIMSILFIVGYVFLAWNYTEGNICKRQNSYLFTFCIYFCCAALIIFGKEILTSGRVCRVLGTFFLLIYPYIIFYCIEMMYNAELSEMQPDKIMINCALLFSVELGLIVMFHNFKCALTILGIVCWMFGLANHYLMQFKGNPLIPGELFAFRTALSVADQYEFALTDELVSGTLILLAVICVIKILPLRIGQPALKKTVIKVIVGVVYFIMFFTVVIQSSWGDKLGIELYAWQIYNTYAANGSILSFILEGQAMHVQVPEGYSKKEIEQILSSNTSETIENNVKPTVIVIMNESFSDLVSLGCFDAEGCLSNWYGIENYVMRGNAYASVYGGGTCNSEYEFLTGNSMANLSSNAYPYTMYNFSRIFNLARLFRDNGYQTVAVHPADKDNWNRSSVYPQMGFQKFVDIEQMENMLWLSWCISDWSDFDWIIKEYEASDGPLFLFNVTMQNHGGYGEKDLGDVEIVWVDEPYQQYTDLVTYLTLIKESDKAFGHLLDYFSGVDKPVIICMFGDHQPSLNSEFVNTYVDENTADIDLKEKRYCVPYLIWSNYFDENLPMNVNKDISLNYLGANISNIAGIESPYTKYLLNLEDKIPVINHIGYMDDKGIWHRLEEANEYIDQYRKMGYYMMFEN